MDESCKAVKTSFLTACQYCLESYIHPSMTSRSQFFEMSYDILKIRSTCIGCKFENTCFVKYIFAYGFLPCMDRLSSKLQKQNNPSKQAHSCLLLLHARLPARMSVIICIYIDHYILILYRDRQVGIWYLTQVLLRSKIPICRWQKNKVYTNHYYYYYYYYYYYFQSGSGFDFER